MCARDEQIATENVRCWCFISFKKKLRKTLEGGGIHPLLYVRGLNFIHKIERKIGNDFGKQWKINFYAFLLYPGPEVDFFMSAESEARGGRKTK